MLKKGKEQIKVKYPLLDADNERRNMTEREILDKYIDLNKSCLSDIEKKEVMDMLYKYKDAFSLRDEIGTCPNIEVEIDITDKSPFSLDHIMSKRKIKKIQDKKMKRLY